MNQNIITREGLDRAIDKLAIDIKTGDCFKGGGIVFSYVHHGDRVMLEVAWPEGHTTVTTVPATAVFPIVGHLSSGDRRRRKQPAVSACSKAS